MKYINSLLFILLATFLFQCATVPITGRSQLRLIGNDQVFPMSYDQYKEVKKESNIITGTDEAEMVKRAGLRIQRAVESYFASEGKSEYLAGYEWEFNLIKEDETVNAWCMPGGKVAFYTGILPICQDETGVAVVMGHEIAHAIANHGRERISQQAATQAGLSGLQVFLGAKGTSEMTEQMVMQGAGAVTTLGILKFSRKHESEADKLGLYFMAMAGYDPRAAPIFWERMSAKGGGQSPPEFLSTHPSHETRISDLNKNMKKALEFYQEAK